MASCTHCSPAVGVRLRTNLIRSFGARRVRSQASSYGGQRNGFVHALCARCRSPLADEPVAIVRCPPCSRASARLPRPRAVPTRPGKDAPAAAGS